MFHGSCRKVSKVLSMVLEPISKSAVHYLAKKVSSVKVSKERSYRMCIAVDETKLRVKKSYVDVDSKELLALEASYGRGCLNALAFLKKALCVQTGRWYWLIEAHGIGGRLRGLSIGMRGLV